MREDPFRRERLTSAIYKCIVSFSVILEHRQMLCYMLLMVWLRGIVGYVMITVKIMCTVLSKRHDDYPSSLCVCLLFTTIPQQSLHIFLCTQLALMV